MSMTRQDLIKLAKLLSSEAEKMLVHHRPDSPDVIGSVLSDLDAIPLMLEDAFAEYDEYADMEEEHEEEEKRRIFCWKFGV